MSSRTVSDRPLANAVSRRLFIAGLLSGGVTVASLGLPNPGVVRAGGARPTRGNLPGWREVFHDDFSTQVNRGAFPKKVSSKWSAYKYPWKDTSKKGRYDPGNVISVNDGVLTKSLRTIDGTPRVAAITPKVTSKAPYGLRYARYEIRFRADRFDGYKFVALLWPDTGTNITGSKSGRGGNGEIDFPELDVNQDRAMGFVHHQDATDRQDQAWMRSDNDPREWHTYTLEWSPNLVVAYVDGAEIGRTTERVPNTKMHLVLQSETSLNNPTRSAHGGNVQIEWVTVWEYDAQTTVSAPPAVAPPKSSVASAPMVSTEWPNAGAEVSGSVPLKARVRHIDGVSAVRWYVDGTGVAYDGNGSPWSADWDSKTLSNGTHRVFSKAKIADGRWITSPSHRFKIRN